MILQRFLRYIDISGREGKPSNSSLESFAETVQLLESYNHRYGAHYSLSWYIEMGFRKLTSSHCQLNCALFAI